jgi:uncharacterized protein YyaL (SSP411 family)
LCAADFQLDAPSEIVVVGKRGSEDTEALLSVVWERFAPNEIVALVDPTSGTAFSTGVVLPLVDGKEMVNGAATAYVCRDHACSEPVTDPEGLRRLLAEGD